METEGSLPGLDSAHVWRSRLLSLGGSREAWSQRLLASPSNLPYDLDVLAMVSRRSPIRKRRPRSVGFSHFQPGLGIRNDSIQRAIDSGLLNEAMAMLEDRKEAMDPVLYKWFETKLAEVRGELGKARESVNSGLAVVRGGNGVSNQPYWLAHFLRKTGVLAWHALETETVENVLEEFERLIERHPTLRYLGADALVLRGHLLEAKGRNGAAVDQYYQAERVARETKDDRRLLRALSLCGRAYRFLRGEHLLESRKKLEEALQLALFLNMRLAELRVRMFLTDLDRASHKPKPRAYHDLRDEASRLGFGTLVLRLNARIVDQLGDKATGEQVRQVIDGFEKAGCRRLALLNKAKAVGSAKAGTIVPMICDVVGSVRRLQRPGDATLVVRDLARAVLRLRRFRTDLGVDMSDVATILRQLEDVSDRNPRSRDLYAEEHGALVANLLDALTPTSPLSVVRRRLHGRHALLATLNAMVALQSKRGNDEFVTYPEIAGEVPGSRDEQISGEAARKRCERLRRALAGLQDTGITLECYPHKGCRLKGLVAE